MKNEFRQLKKKDFVNDGLVDSCRQLLNQYDGYNQGWTDPTGIRAMPWGPPPKGSHQTSKKHANQQK